MNIQRKRRLYYIIAILIGVSIAALLVLYALKQNIDLYETPSQVVKSQLKPGQSFRLGGMVVKGSVHHDSHNLNVQFTLTDFHNTIRVKYNGILPALFHEGQGIVSDGHLNHSGVFVATQVLAKHDENYKPPSIDGNATRQGVNASLAQRDIAQKISQRQNTNQSRMTT